MKCLAHTQTLQHTVLIIWCNYQCSLTLHLLHSCLHSCAVCCLSLSLLCCMTAPSFWSISPKGINRLNYVKLILPNEQRNIWQQSIFSGKEQATRVNLPCKAAGGQGPARNVATTQKHHRTPILKCAVPIKCRYVSADLILWQTCLDK